MEAARVAALRGHTVSLYEKGERLGGQLLLSTRPPFKGEIENLTQYLSHQLRKVGVNVVLGTEAKPEMIDASRPDFLKDHCTFTVLPVVMWFTMQVYL